MAFHSILNKNQINNKKKLELLILWLLKSLKVNMMRNVIFGALGLCYFILYVNIILITAILLFNFKDQYQKMNYISLRRLGMNIHLKLKICYLNC